MNINQINDELMEIRAAVAERDRLARELERAEGSLGAERDELRRLADGLRKENDDVRRLEGTSLVGIFYAVMGSREARLDKERQEVLAAKLKHDNCQRRVAALERDITELRARLETYRANNREDLSARYEALLAEKERLLSAPGTETARQLSTLSDEMAEIRAQQRELCEALQAGEAARAGLNHVVEALQSASDWGTWDLLGGGMLSSAVKHAKLDEAHNAAQDAQPLLQRFDRELADVNGTGALTMQTDGLTTFADIMVDGLLIDLLVQSRINESLNAARAAAKRVADLLDRLTRQQAEVERRAGRVEASRRDLLERV